MRDGIRAIIDNSSKYNIVGEAADGNEALEFIRTHHVDLVVIDINMPNMDGVTCTKAIKKSQAEIKVLAVSMHLDDLHVMKMHQAGANGYISKDVGMTVFLEAIEAIESGKSYHTPEIKEVILSHFTKSTQERSKNNPLEFLTKREIVILKLIVEEMSNVQIADKLCVSVRTVDSHRRNLLRKVGVGGAVGLTKFAIKHGI
jgi:DNA-binding NarL/FixJ family response regulator